MLKRKKYSKLREAPPDTPIRSVPVPLSKYSPVWLRVRAKLRSHKYKPKSDTNKSLDSQDNERFLFLQDISVTQKTDIEMPLPVGLLHPSGRVKTFWNFVILFLLLYTATIMPFRISFIEFHFLDYWHYADIIVDAFFFIDVIIHCMSTYYTENGILERNRYRIICRYAR
jgi:hypothetical protein